MTEKTVNYESEKILIIHNPEGAGGKMVLSCLTLSNQVSPLNKELATALLQGENIIERSYKAILTAFSKKIQFNKHVEDGGSDFRGFDNESPTRKATDIWIEITNQNKIYGYLGNHSEAKNDFYMYKKAKHLVLKDISVILADRNFDSTTKSFDKIEHHSISMNKVTNRNDWYEEVKKACDYLSIPYPNEQKINTIRKGWLKTYKIGF